MAANARRPPAHSQGRPIFSAVFGCFFSLLGGLQFWETQQQMEPEAELPPRATIRRSPVSLRPEGPNEETIFAEPDHPSSPKATVESRFALQTPSGSIQDLQANAPAPADKDQGFRPPTGERRRRATPIKNAFEWLQSLEPVYVSRPRLLRTQFWPLCGSRSTRNTKHPLPLCPSSAPSLLCLLRRIRHPGGLTHLTMLPGGEAGPLSSQPLLPLAYSVELAASNVAGYCV